MDDGNVLVGYNHPAYNVVMVELARQNGLEVEARYLDGLAESEVLMTPLGQKKFDDFGKLALLGRCYMFMDAQDPQVERDGAAGLHSQINARFQKRRSGTVILMMASDCSTQERSEMLHRKALKGTTLSLTRFFWPHTANRRHHPDGKVDRSGCR